MLLRGTIIEDTFAEAFPMWVTRLVFTADTPRLANRAAESAVGLATSIVGCGCEAGVGEDVAPANTRDGRPGKAALFFGYTTDILEEQLIRRIGQAVLTSATSACYNGLEGSKTRPIGGKLRYFGDGFQSSKVIDGIRYWRIPVADGEFVVEESFGFMKGVGGGNMILTGAPRAAVLAAAEAAVEAILSVNGVITPFPGGVCRSPSKVGSKYLFLRASTNHPFCPTLRSRCETQLAPKAEAAYEIVIDGLTEEAVAQSMRLGLLAACGPGVQVISAGNYGGKLGPYHFHLLKLIGDDVPCA